MPHELLLEGPRRLRLATYEEQPLAANQVRCQAVLSALSHGTEISLYRGTSPFHGRRFDAQQRLFVDAPLTDAYPQRLGYEWVGRVTAVGAAVTGYREGDLVHLPLPHRTTQTFEPQAVAALGVQGPLPPALDPDRALFLSSAAIALQAVHDARLKVGDHVVIFGLGVLGLLTVQLARLNGARRIDAVDPLPDRRELALACGATATFDPAATDIGLASRQAGPGADVAIEFSGRYAALQQAMRSLRMSGLVVAAGFYQGPAHDLRLGEEWLHNRITMVASSRGWGNAHRDYPLWDRARVQQSALALLADRSLRVDGLPVQRYAFAEAAAAYAAIDRGAAGILKAVLAY